MDTIGLTIDDVEVKTERSTTILEAAWELERNQGAFREGMELAKTLKGE